MYKVTGKIDGNIQTITYQYIDGKGVIEGDKAIIFLVQWEMDNKTIVGPVGQYMEADVDNPLSVLFVIKKCFDEVISVEGEIPEADGIPEGSIS